MQAAKLRVYVAEDPSNNGPAVYGATSSWTESAITWATRPSRAGAPSANSGVVAAGTWVEYDVRPLVTGNGNVSFALVGDSSDAVGFASREYADPAKKAQLEVTFAGQ